MRTFKIMKIYKKKLQSLEPERADQLTRILQIYFVIMKKIHFIPIKIGRYIGYDIPCTINIGEMVLCCSVLTALTLLQNSTSNHFEVEVIYHASCINCLCAT